MLLGGCYCGAVRYVVEGPVFHATLCHCSACRRISGAPAVAWFSTRMDALRFAQGDPATFRSSAHVLRGFCARCGTTLTYQHDGVPDQIDIATATLDDPGAAPPRDHTFAAERLDWVVLEGGLPAYPRTRAEGSA